jgi:DNA-binding transcriptional LysR family regulator
MDQLSAMRAFVRVVEAGTFTRAADLLDMPKPTVTKQIQQLEAHLRAKLLNRTTRRVTVTMDGAAYYERALRVLERDRRARFQHGAVAGAAERAVAGRLQLHRWRVDGD